MTSVPGPAIAVAQKILALAQKYEGETNNEIRRRSIRAQLQDMSDELLRAILTPSEYAILVAEAFHESSALNLATAAKVADALGDGHSTVQDLASKTGYRAHHLGKPSICSLFMNLIVWWATRTALTCLASKGIFEEVDGFGCKIFKNNENSRVLSGSHPDAVDGAIGFICDEGFKSASRLADAASPSVSVAGLPAGSLAFNVQIPLFKWIASQPENAWRLQRQMKAYDQLHHMANHGLEEDFAWGALRSPIVDVGCGIASTERALLEHASTKHLRFTLFDLPPVLEKTRKLWEEAGVQDKATFIAGDFFQTPSVIPAGAPTYMLRHIFLEWQDDKALIFLKNIHDAMMSDSVLLVVEVLLHEDSDRLIRTSSMHMLSLNNAVTRTLPETIVLLEKVGFKLKKVNRLLAADSVIEFVKA
ncbi:hypothetical protein NLJ89_g2378 [Agrocybe chaxingu]|uniref:O-methyltransferase C-terminal domain-containing protein n=1 Tax=Agrocybe chaxingu TaxID=84603 RepID=A0A9W8MWI7_9AGAR|nr:hypothetical protein NLJ89_g2378 [Agrocybe chaxingu]